MGCWGFLCVASAGSGQPAEYFVFLVQDGPVLSQTDLYLLNTELELHPIMANTHGNFHLVFSLITGTEPSACASEIRVG
jgi:hypothetical protein